MTNWREFKQAYLIKFWNPLPAVIAAGILFWSHGWFVGCYW